MGDVHREVLIAVAGLTPQVITETIYALSQKKIPVYIDEIYIITTSTGKKFIVDTLLKKGILDKLAEEHNLKPIKITDENFIIAKDSSGEEIDDIITEHHNEIIGDIITTTVKGLASDPATRLHCSIAGGRKTMSFYLGVALQLFGRPQDRLYHVLVSPEFESNPDFFYKPKKNKIIEARLLDGTVKRLNTKDAWIELAELPFIRLGEKLNLSAKNFRELVEEGQNEIDRAITHPEISINIGERNIKIKNKTINIQPVQLMVYTAFLRQKTDNCMHRERKYCGDCTDCFVTASDFKNSKVFQSVLDDYAKMYRHGDHKKEELLKRWEKALMPSDIIRQNISKINRLLKTQLNDAPISQYCTITNVKAYGSTRYGVKAEKSKIKINGE